MDSIVVTGGSALEGQIPIAGAKNACLALMPATLLTEEPLTLMNAPRLSDIKTMTLLLQSLGAEVQSLQDGRVIAMSSLGPVQTTADYDIVRKMRASNLVLGPLLAREGHAIVSLPGGCAIGARPMDIHITALEAMGAEIELRDGYLHAKTSGGLKGATVPLRFASVGATENVLMAAVLAGGMALSAGPAMAEDPAQEMERLAREAAETIMMALSVMLAAIPQYEAPEILENGDIIIRRKNPPGEPPRETPEPAPRLSAQV